MSIEVKVREREKVTGVLWGSILCSKTKAAVTVHNCYKQESTLKRSQKDKMKVRKS